MSYLRIFMAQYCTKALIKSDSVNNPVLSNAATASLINKENESEKY